MLEIAILGLLNDSPMHGYELRKRLSTLLGAFRAFSYGSLYPSLRRLQEAGWIDEEAPLAEPAGGVAARPKRGGSRPAPSGASGSTGSPPRARSTSPRCSPKWARRPTTTRGSAPGW